MDITYKKVGDGKIEITTPVAPIVKVFELSYLKQQETDLMNTMADFDKKLALVREIIHNTETVLAQVDVAVEASDIKP